MNQAPLSSVTVASSAACFALASCARDQKSDGNPIVGFVDLLVYIRNVLRMQLGFYALLGIVSLIAIIWFLAAIKCRK